MDEVNKEEREEEQVSLTGLMSAVEPAEIEAPGTHEARASSPVEGPLLAPTSELEARHLALLGSRAPHVTELEELYATAHGKQLEQLMRQVRQSEDVPTWVLLAMTSRMMRATESEQCDVLNAMASTPHHDAVCLICRELFEQASPRHELAMVSILGQRGDRRDYQLLAHRLEERDLSQELKVALKRALMHIEARHPKEKLATSAGGLTMSSAPAEAGALTIQHEEERALATMPPQVFDADLRHMLSSRSIEVLATTPHRRGVGAALLQRREYDWLTLSQGPHKLKPSVLFALIVHESVGWPAGFFLILFFAPILMGIVVIFATRAIFTLPVMAVIFGTFVRQRHNHYAMIFERGELFLADVSFPEGDERACMDLSAYNDARRPALRRHVRLSSRLATRYKQEPELRAVVLWDDEGGGMLMLDDCDFLGVDDHGRLTVRSSSSVMPGMIFGAAMSGLAGVIILLIYILAFQNLLF